MPTYFLKESHDGHTCMTFNCVMCLIALTDKYIRTHPSSTSNFYSSSRAHVTTFTSLRQSGTPTSTSNVAVSLVFFLKFPTTLIRQQDIPYPFDRFNLLCSVPNSSTSISFCHSITNFPRGTPLVQKKIIAINCMTRKCYVLTHSHYVSLASPSTVLTSVN